MLHLLLIYITKEKTIQKEKKKSDARDNMAEIAWQR